MTKPKKFVQQIRTEQDKNGRPIPIYKIKNQPVKLEMPEIKKVKL